MGFEYLKSSIFVIMKNFRGVIFSLSLQLLSLIIFLPAASAQTKKELKEIFAQAESYYLYEEYDLANQLYIIMENPENLNLSYKIGTCYLNIPDEKEKAIPYLEASVKNAVYDAKAGSFKEKRAPLDAYFYLGKAYMINNELEKGLNTLQTFANLARDLEGKGRMENLEFVDQQMLACKNAIKFVENPVTLTKKRLGPGFSQGSMNENPAVSFDGNTIAYTEKRGLVNVILFSKKVRGKWQNPVEITEQLNAGEDCSTCALSADGSELFLYKTDMFDGNIYSSKYTGDKWSPIVKLNKNINTKYYESHASVSADGKRLYFTSNREGGQGGLDIYMSEKDGLGEWGLPVNLGTAVNTPYNEDIPFITENDSLLYFCSEGHNSMGGYDNFKSMKTGNEWKKPESLGYPVNTTGDDKFFQPSLNGMTAFYSMKTDYKKRDIFYLGLGGVDVNQIYEIAGKFSLNDTAFASAMKYNIHVLGKESGDTLYTGTPDRTSGLYSIIVAPGSFRIAYSGDGYLTQTIDTTIIQDNPDQLINLDVSLEPAFYEKINLTAIPVVMGIDSSILIRNMLVSNVDDVIDSDVLYYTVQVMALYNPVDVSYFKHITDMKVMYNEVDRFYRYTSGRFSTREEAADHIKELKRKGYPDGIFIKKVSK